MKKYLTCQTGCRLKALERLFVCDLKPRPTFSTHKLLNDNIHLQQKTYSVVHQGAEYILKEYSSRENQRLACFRLKCLDIHYEAYSDNSVKIPQHRTTDTLLTQINELKQSKTSFTQDNLLLYLNRIIDQCLKMHDKGLVDLDVNLKNILRDGTLVDFDDLVFLGDFEEESRNIGVDKYYQPELLRKYKTKYQTEASKAISLDGKAREAWCIGVVMYTLACQKFPFSGADDIVSKECDVSLLSKYPILKPVIQKLLEKDAQKRWSLVQVKHYLDLASSKQVVITR